MKDKGWWAQIGLVDQTVHVSVPIQVVYTMGLDVGNFKGFCIAIIDNISNKFFKRASKELQDNILFIDNSHTGFELTLREPVPLEEIISMVEEAINGK